MKRITTTASTILIVSGLILLANIWCETQRQHETQQQLDRQLVETSSTTQIPEPRPDEDLPDWTPPTTPPPTSSPPTTPAPTLNLGQPLGTIQIPAINVNQIVVYGIGEQELKGGPGVYPYTPAPWEGGNTAVAAHRTTNGAPFGDLDLLEPGDIITFDTINGMFVYTVTGTQIVGSTDMTPVQDFGDNRITLTACHPKGSAKQRIVVTAHQQAKETQI